MKLKLIHFSASDDDTLGILYCNGILECFILEDEQRDKKVYAETRIPNGKYEIKYRNAGRMHGIYTDRWDWHKGMLELQDVPNFTYIYIHPGNNDDHTAGCLLPGDCVYTNIVRNGYVGRSSIAYERLYKKVSQALDRGEKVTIEIKDLCGKTF